MGEGSKYQATKGETCAQIAKRIRKDIKAVGLPEGVTVQVISDYNSVDINVRGLGDARTYLPQDDDRQNFRRAEYTPVAQKLVDELTKIHFSYNYDKSDIQVDHFDTRYYGHVSIERDDQAAWRKKNEADARNRTQALKAQKAAAEAAPFYAAETDNGIGVYAKSDGRRVTLIRLYDWQLRNGVKHSETEYYLSTVGYEVVRYDRTKRAFDVVRKSVMAVVA